MRLLAASLALVLAAAQAGAAHWMKTHALAPYGESWNSELVVADLAAAQPPGGKGGGKAGGKLVQPLALMAAGEGVQQVSLVVDPKRTKALTKALRKLGALTEPRVHRSQLAAEALDVKEKLAALLKERSEQEAAYKKIPATAQAVDEIIAHLTDAQAAATAGRSAVLWNLTVRRR
jgi:hypothetical protein